MKIISSFLFVLCFIFAAAPQIARAQYGDRIAIPTESGASLKSTAQDAAQTLQKMTGRDYSVAEQYSGAGIWLMRADSPEAPADAKKQLEGKGREPFLIRSSDENRLLIVANLDEGLEHGLYFYLEQLGARFYFPSEKWTILPSKQNVALKIDRLVVPDYRLREFFGTGGFGPKMPNDPNQSIKARWELWKRRNRFGGEFSLGGHSGEAFNLANKETLLAHPEYLAKVDGKYVPWSQIAKLNPANPDAVKLYVDWTVARFRAQRERDPDGRASFAVSVDPSDGGGHCNSEECLQIGSGSASDQVFYVANQAAKAVAKEFPGAYVNLYGYNEHATPPTIPLEPNIYVVIIPYAFQRTGLSPEEFIKAWGAKVPQMGIYDYWSIPDWTGDLPSFDYLHTPDQKLHLWRANNIDAFLSESTNSAGAVGLAWYLSSRLMWDLKTPQQPILDEFYEKSFGEARAPMQRMMERWADNFRLGSQELALSYRDLNEAISLGKTPEVRARLADYGRYLEYLRLRFEMEQAPSDQTSAARATLVKYVWDIYDTAMIHSFREYQLLTRPDKELRDSYDAKNKDAAGWKTIALPSDDEVFNAVSSNAEKLKPLDYQARRFSGELTPLPIVPAGQNDEKPAEITLVGATTLSLNSPGGSTLPLKLNGNQPVKVRLQNADGKIIFEKEIESGGENWRTEWQEVEVPMPAAGKYQLSLLALKNDLVRLQAPQGINLVLQSFRTSKPFRSPRLYFYVPKGLKTLAIYQPLPLPAIMEFRFYDADGNKVAPETHDNRQVYLVKIPEGQDGKVWSLDNIVAPNQTIEMLNAPQTFSLYPNTLLVPQDAL